MPEAFLCDYIRTPIGRFAGALSSVRTDDLAAVPLRALMDRNAAVDWEDLGHSLAQIEGVVSVFAVSGEVDLMLEIVARDMQHYAQVILHEVIGTQGVNATRSSFVLEEVKSIY